MLLPGKKYWIGCGIMDESTLETAHDSYGAVALDWVTALKNTINNWDLITTIFGHILTQNEATKFLGTSYPTL